MRGGLGGEVAGGGGLRRGDKAAADLRGREGSVEDG